MIRASSKRVVKIVTNKSLIQIKKNYPNIPSKTYVRLFKDFAKANPDIIFEGNLKEALQDSINAIKEALSAEFLSVQDAKGLEEATVLVLVKDIHHVIREYIARKLISRPRVAIGQDGGNNKYLVTLAIFDMDKLGPDLCGYSSGGRRRSLIIAACNRLRESRTNIDRVLDRLMLVKLEYHTILPCDLKCANILMALSTHTSLCPCLYCEAFKVSDTGNPTTRKALHWSTAERRTVKRIREVRARWEAKWQGKLDSKKAKDDHKNFASVIGSPIQLPEAMTEIPLLLVIPPDPLHCILLGPGNDIVGIIEKVIDSKR